MLKGKEEEETKRNKQTKKSTRKETYYCPYCFSLNYIVLWEIISYLSIIEH